MDQQLLFGVAVVPSIIGLVELSKSMGIPDRFAPASAVLLGILAGLAQIYGTHISWVQGTVLGISLGLSAVGLHAGTKSTVKPAETSTRSTVLATKEKIRSTQHSTSPIETPWDHGNAP